MGPVPSHSDLDAPVAHRIRPRLVAAARTGRAWIRSGRVCAVLAALLLIAFLAQNRIPGSPGHRPRSNWLAADPHHPEHLWTLVTAWMSSPRTPLIGLLLLLTLGIAMERRLGARRFLVTALPSHVCGVGLALVCHPIIAPMWPAWGRQLLSRSVAGVGLLLLGPFMVVAGTMNATWRRRIHWLTLLTAILIVGVTGKPTTIAWLGAVSAGIVLAGPLARPLTPDTAIPSTPHSERNMVALIVCAWAGVLILTVLSREPFGPLSDARTGILPTSFGVHHKLGGTVLILMPLFLQLTLADGLRRGRRAAAVGTIALQGFLALCSVLSAAAIGLETESALRPISPSWLASKHLILPLALNIAVILLVVWNHDHLRLHTRPGVIRTAIGFWVLSVIALGALSVVLGGAATRQFTPTATLPDLAIDYVINLLPASAVGFLVPVLTPVGPLAHVAAVWCPAAAWASAIVCTWAALHKPAVTASASRADLKALVRTHGAGTLGWMLTWPGNEAWTSPDGESGFAFRAGSGVALTLSDPAADPERIPRTVEAFAHYAHQAGMVPALYSVHEPTMLAARKLGWTVLQVAQEAVIDLPDLAFRGKAFQDVRTALNHAGREGITAVWTSWDEAPDGQRDQIRAISQSWARDKALPEMGFTLGGLTEIDDDETRLLLAVDAEGTVQAVTSWMPVYRDGRVIGLTLDVMRRREGGWRPAIEFLIARAAQDAQARGLEMLSLSGAPLARSGPSGDLNGDGTDDVGAARFDPMLDLLAQLLEPAYGFASLHSFKRKFCPRTVPMFLAVPDVVHLPAVGVAIARAYVPKLTAAQAARFAQVVAARG